MHSNALHPAAVNSLVVAQQDVYMITTENDIQARLCNKKLLSIVLCNLSLTHQSMHCVSVSS